MQAIDIVTTLAIGIGATAFMDLWLLLQKSIGMPTGSLALIGRWVGHFRQGRFAHRAIGSAPARCRRTGAGLARPLRHRSRLRRPARRRGGYFMARPTHPGARIGLRSCHRHRSAVRHAAGDGRRIRGIPHANTRHPLRQKPGQPCRLRHWPFRQRRRNGPDGALVPTTLRKPTPGAALACQIHFREFEP